MSLKSVLRALLVTAAVGMLGACGGGGGATVDTTVVSGVVSKGIFTNGTVKVYAVNSDGTQTLLKTDIITAGAYRADLGTAYAGPVLVVAYGTYADEATGQAITIDEAAALKAAVPAATAATTVVVTPLTDLAVREATTGDKIAVGSISAANTAVAALFGVDNIITTKPVAFDVTNLTNALPAQKKYTEVLALVSQYVANSTTTVPTATDLQKSLTELSGGIVVSGTTAAVSSPLVTANLNSAINATLANPKTSAVLAVDTAAKDNLVPVVASLGSNTIVKYTLKIEGAAASSAYGVQTTVTLPGTVVLPEGEVTTSGIVVPAAWFPSGNFAANVQQSKLLVALASGATTPFQDTTFATLYLKVPQGSDIPAKGAFSFASTAVKDKSGVTLDGSSVSISDGTAISVQ